MTTLAVVGDLGPSNSNVLDFVRRLHAMHGAATVETIEQRIRADVASQIGDLPNCAYFQAQAVAGWKNLQRTPDEAVRRAVQCARATVQQPDSVA